MKYLHKNTTKISNDNKRWLIVALKGCKSGLNVTKKQEIELKISTQSLVE